VRRGVRGLLEGHGWEVVGEAVDGREALEMVQSLRPNLLILDIAMPRLNGLEVTRQLRKTSPDCRILILTMHDSEQMVRSFLAAGAMGYVLKSDAAQHLGLAHGERFTGPSDLE
jgi:DNA-binding NarL/FixJ family response regulator